MTNVTLLTLFSELASSLIDEITYHWDNAFKNLLPAVFTKLQIDSANRIYELSDEADQRMQSYMTESARQKLRFQMRGQIDHISESVNNMQRTLVGGGTRGMLRKRLVCAMKDEMSHVWKECVKTTGTSHP